MRGEAAHLTISVSQPLLRSIFQQIFLLHPMTVSIIDKSCLVASRSDSVLI